MDTFPPPHTHHTAQRGRQEVAMLPVKLEYGAQRSEEPLSLLIQNTQKNIPYIINTLEQE